MSNADALDPPHMSGGEYIQRLEADVARLRLELTAFQNALTPSAETKTKHIGEFETPACFSDGHSFVPAIVVSWRTIKKIMAAIRKHAEANC